MECNKSWPQDMVFLSVRTPTSSSRHHVDDTFTFRLIDCSRLVLGWASAFARLCAPFWYVISYARSRHYRPYAAIRNE